MSGTVRTAIVGAGLMGRWHAHAARRAGAAIVGFVDPDVESARALARRFGGIGAAFLDEVVDEADVVHICTPLAAHVDIAEAALEHGKHVLCEKPLAPTADEAERLLEIADRRQLLLCPVHQYPFQRGVRRARARLPALGRLLHVDATACTAGADGRSEAARDALAGEILPHPLSLLEILAGECRPASGWSVRHPSAGEYRIQARIGNLTVGFLISTRGRPTQNTSRWTCEGGTLHIDHFHGFSVVERGAVSRRRKLLRPFALAGALGAEAGVNLAVRATTREPAFPGLGSLVRRFYASVGAEAPAPLGRRHTIEVARARDAILAEAD